MGLRKVKALIEHQNLLKNLINSAYDQFTEDGELSITPQRVKARIASVEKTRDEFSRRHSELIIAFNELNRHDRSKLEGDPYFHDEGFASAYAQYDRVIDQFAALLAPELEPTLSSSSVQTASQTSAVSSSGQAARLPRIDLPKFNGSPADWLSFKDLFTSLVLENPNVSTIEKFQYLKTSLIGSASHLLKSTALTTDNFQSAWASLVTFYENKRVLVNAALNSFFSLKRMTKKSATEMEQLYTGVMQVYRTIEALERPIQYWDDVLVFSAAQKLDSDSREDWEDRVGASTEPPTWKQFCDFLVTRFCSLYAVENSVVKKPIVRPHPQTVASHFSETSRGGRPSRSASCSVCSGKHYIVACLTYNAKLSGQRLSLVTRLNLCFNCLGNHKLSDCRNAKRCFKCGLKHHSSLHHAYRGDSTGKGPAPDVKPDPTPLSGPALKPDSQPECAPAVNSEVVSNSATVVHSAASSDSLPCVLLATAQVIVVASNGDRLRARALIDQGSEVSLISERLAQGMNLKRKASSITVMGIGAQTASKARGIASFTIQPHFASSFECAVSALILPQLTISLPSVGLSAQLCNHLRGLSLADPDYSSSRSIDLILGADVYGKVIEDGLIKGDGEGPTAQRTNLGWILSGPAALLDSGLCRRNYHVHADGQLHELLRRFWELEEVVAPTTSSLSVEEQDCELHFQATHTRDVNGRYQLRLPFKSPPSRLGDSKVKASRIMSGLFRKLASNSPYSRLYSDFMNSYAQLKHMTPISASDPEPQYCYYLPHHGVFREHSSTSKLRVVFNGSSPSTTGYSLNDLLHTGAKLQTNLFDVLLWFRQFPFVFSADMEKMYRQINVHPDDWNFQRILWTNQSGQQQVHQLTTVTYGLACAPFQALRTLQQLIEDEGERFPLAVPTLVNGRYVDDVFGGADTVEQSRSIVAQLDSLCMAGGFPLHKWVANSSEILEAISPEKMATSPSVIIDETQFVHALGLIWNTQEDVFKFTLTLVPPDTVTKRSVLSVVAKMFDPLGLLSPILITAKILIQELWAVKLDWDDPLPAELTAKWSNFVDGLRFAPELVYPRWIGVTSGASMELHGFCDASSRAMAATVYVRSVNSEGIVTVRLLCAKTKVAPLKRLTIPRLELSGAALLVKLLSHVLKVVDRDQARVYLWTDSMVAFTWINNHPSRWKEFVHNRVCYIQDSIPQAVWRFVPGSQNPADLATRGLTPDQLLSLTAWWQGPPWLSEPIASWPCEPVTLLNCDQLEERAVKSAVTNPTSVSRVWELIDRYSNLSRLLRITAICKRTSDRLRRKAPSLGTTPLSTLELDQAKKFWVKQVQQSSFHREFRDLSDGRVVAKTSPLIRLVPFIDNAGLLRVGGRLHLSNLSEDGKHPLIVPKESAFASLLISDAHRRTFHGGTQLTTSFLRNEFWIMGGRQPVRSFIFKCVRCARFRQIRAQQLMGSLPVERVTPSRPFLNTGVDYAGPFSLKTWKGKNAKTYKAYICLFVCHSTSAIHLEIVTDYTTEAFLAAFKRFTSRRGICSTLISDCGTNFQGADSELQALFVHSSTELDKLAGLLANDGTQWRFNPPSSPHFGGKWEAGVKSVKFHLKRVVGDRLLTYEEMNTLVTQIEAALNSRPLCPLTDDPDDLSVLTPGHFLIGHAPSLVPEPSLESEKEARLSRWQLIRQMLERFWTQWSSECLQRHLSIYKWNRAAPNLKIGTLVLIVDERYPPAKWPLGRIIATHPGVDGCVRVVTIRTPTSVIKRPIVKVCPLPIETDTM